MLIHKLGIATGSLVVLFSSSVSALALGGAASAHANAEAMKGGTTMSASSNMQMDSSSTGMSASTSTNASSTPGSKGQANRLAAQQRACQNRQAAINNILTRLVTRGTNQLTLFSTIAARAEAFATTKNLTVANLSSLETTAQADQAKATSDLAAMKANQTINCSSPDPKAMVTAFQADLKQEISDLQTYRTDVKNIIVAIKTSVGAANSTSSDSKTTSTTGTTGTTSNTGTTTTTTTTQSTNGTKGGN